MLFSENNPQMLRKDMTVDIRVIDILNQLFRRGFYTQISFSKKSKVVRSKPRSFVLSIPFCLSIGF